MNYINAFLDFLKALMPIVNTAAAAAIGAANTQGIHMPAWVFIAAAVLNALALYGGTPSVQNKLADARDAKRALAEIRESREREEG